MGTRTYKSEFFCIYIFSHSIKRGIMPKYEVTEAQILGTRECNRRCEYCRLVNEAPFGKEDEFGIDEWKIAFKKMDAFGIKTAKGLGGEWTIKEYLPELILFINDETAIKFALLSNSSFGPKLKNELAGAGLNGYFASVDRIDVGALKTESYNKSGPGLKMLLDFKALGVRNLCANTVLMRENISEIPMLLEYLTENEIAMNLCPVHGGGDYPFEYRSKSKELCLNEKDLPKLEKLVSGLLDMKDDGYLLAAPSSYLVAIQAHAIGQDWKCNEFSQLRIDANGGIKVCPDGGFLHHIDHIEDDFETDAKYNILQMDEKEYRNIYSSWELNEWRKNCPGCGPWSAQYRAEKNKKYGIGDPVLAERKNR